MEREWRENIEKEREKERQIRRERREKRERERRGMIERLIRDYNLSGRRENKKFVIDRVKKIEKILSNPIKIDDSQLIKIKESNHDSCIICLDDFNIDDNMINLECSHFFHEECIKKWFLYNNKCPLCKKEYNFDNNEIKNYSIDLLNQIRDEINIFRNEIFYINLDD